MGDGGKRAHPSPLKIKIHDPTKRPDGMCLFLRWTF